MKLSKKQADYYKNSNYKINVAHGAVRSGKTFISNVRWLKYVRSEAPPGKLLMSGVTSETLQENVLDDIETMVGRANFSPPKKGGIAKLYDRVIEVRGAENIASERRIRGRTYAGWYADEITLHHKSFVNQAVTRCSVRGAKIFWTTNPDHPKHHILTEFIKNPRLLEKGQIRDWLFLLTDNLTLSDEYKELLKNSFSGVFYQRNIEGKWVIAEGLVYGDFNEERHVIPHEEVLLMIKHGLFKYFIAGVDWGHSHPMASGIYGVTHDNRYVQIDEFYQVRKQTEDLGRWLLYMEKEVLKQRLKYVFADTAEPDRIVTLASKPFSFPMPKTRKDIDAGLNSVMMTLKPEPPRLLISDKCENTISEMLTYRFPEEDDPKFKKDEPLDEDNHAMDQKRYAIHNHEIILIGQGMYKDRQGRPRQTTRRSRRQL